MTCVCCVESDGFMQTESAHADGQPPGLRGKGSKGRRGSKGKQRHARRFTGARLFLLGTGSLRWTFASADYTRSRTGMACHPAEEL